MSISPPIACHYVSFSHDGNYVAICGANKLEIRDSVTLDIISTSVCSNVVQKIEWAQDSNFIITCSFSGNLVEVWAVHNPDWQCKINEGSSGLVAACWSPDSRHVLTTAEFFTHITVWSLTSKCVSYIKYPKKANPGLQFSPDDKLCAVAERRNGKDLISMFDVSTWKMLVNFSTTTRDLVGIQWSKNSCFLAVQDAVLEYHLMIYSPEGKCLCMYSAYEEVLGILAVGWSPSSQFIAVGSFHEKVRLLTHTSWHVVAELCHSSEIESCDCVVYNEIESEMVGYEAKLTSVQGLPAVDKVSYTVVETRPLNLISSRKIITDRSNIGCHVIRFSSDGRYLATRNKRLPWTVWIWDLSTLQLAALLIHKNDISDITWDPNGNRLAICSGGSCIYFWSPSGCSTVSLPRKSSQVLNLSWNANGASLLAVMEDSFVVCSLTPL